MTDVMKEVKTNTEAVEAVDVLQAVDGVESVEPEVVKPYTLRKLCADDIFPMARIIVKIGFEEFKDIFQQDNIKNILKKVTERETAEGNDNSDIATSVGVQVMFSVGQIVLTNLTSCRDDIYNFLSGVSGMEQKDIAALDLEVFAEMIIDVFQKPEFANFIKVVSKLLK